MNNAPLHYAIVLSGGLGTRFSPLQPKQLVEIGGKPLLCYAIDPLEKSQLIDKIVVVCPPEYGNAYHDIFKKSTYKKIFAVVDGGATRQESAFKALHFLRTNHVDDDDIVFVLDGDRPNIREACLDANLKAALKYGAAVTAIAEINSVFISHKGKTAGKYLSRESIFEAQTPQTFRFSIIYRAHEKAFEKHIVASDDASLVRLLHKKVALVPGYKENIKITTKDDVALFLSYLR